MESAISSYFYQKLFDNSAGADGGAGGGAMPGSPMAPGSAAASSFHQQYAAVIAQYHQQQQQHNLTPPYCNNNNNNNNAALESLSSPNLQAAAAASAATTTPTSHQYTADSSGHHGNPFGLASEAVGACNSANHLIGANSLGLQRKSGPHDVTSSGSAKRAKRVDHITDEGRGGRRRSPQLHHQQQHQHHLSQSQQLQYGAPTTENGGAGESPPVLGSHIISSTDTAIRVAGLGADLSQQISKFDSSEFDDDKEVIGNDAEGVWATEIEHSFQEALAIYPPCGRRKIILSDEGKMYGRNELIARYIKLRTGKTRTRKQVSSHIQVLARRKLREIQAKIKVPGSNNSFPNGLNGFGQEQTSQEKTLQSMQKMSSAQIVTASVQISQQQLEAAAAGKLPFSIPQGLRAPTNGASNFWQPGLNSDVLASRLSAASPLANSRLPESTEAELASDRYSSYLNSVARMAAVAAQSASPNGPDLRASEHGAKNNNTDDSNGGAVSVGSQQLSLLAANKSRLLSMTDHQLNMHQLNPPATPPPSSSETTPPLSTTSSEDGVAGPHHQQSSATSASAIYSNGVVAATSAGGALTASTASNRADVAGASGGRTGSPRGPPSSSSLWEADGKSIATRRVRLREFSAYVESSSSSSPTVLPPSASGDADQKHRGPGGGDLLNRHLFIHIDPSTTMNTHLDPVLETVDIRQIQDKFPEKKGGLKDLFDRGQSDAFYLVKFWADLSTNIADESASFYGVTTTYESPESMMLQCSTKVCSFGKQVVEKVETEYGRFEGGRYVYNIARSPMCDYMINFIHKLKHLPKKYMMNCVLENFTILQVISNRDTQETLLCLAFVFEVSTSEHGAQHHIYRLTKED